LQQTTVAQATPYFLKFKKSFPNIFALARASEEVVMKHWQGLGYYSRARNLHFTAKHICHQCDGKFPDTYADLLKLKGVGKYTAAAIASFAYALPYAVLDGNVYRVLSRVFGYDAPIDTAPSRKYFETLAQKCLHLKKAAPYNQAIMDFGALQCIPKKPNCEICPMRKFCKAYQNETVAHIPIKSKKLKKKERYFQYIVFNIGNEKTLLTQRVQKDIWEKLFQFPLYESKSFVRLNEISSFIKKEFELNMGQFEIVGESAVYTHLLSHQKLKVKFLFVNLNVGILKNNLYFVSNFDAIKNFAVPKVIDNFLVKGNIKSKFNEFSK